MQLIQTVAPIKEPLTLLEVKEFLRISNTDDDALISSLIGAVREHIEKATNRQLEIATFELIDAKLFTTLPGGSFITIDKIEYLDENLDYILFELNKYYSYVNNGIGSIYFNEIPALQTHKKAIKVTFTCGYSEVPEAIKQYMKVKIATLYENREEFVIGVSISEFGSKFIENLLSPYKIRSI